MSEPARTVLLRGILRRRDPWLGLVLLVILPSALFVAPWVGYGPCVDEAQLLARVHPDVIGHHLSEAIRSVAARCCSVGDRPAQELWSWLFMHRLHLPLAGTQVFAFLLHAANLGLVWCLVRRETSSYRLALATAALAGASQYSLWTSIDVAATNETLRAFFLLSAMAAALYWPTAWLRTALVVTASALALVSKETSLCCFPALCFASWRRGRRELVATSASLFVLGVALVSQYSFPSSFDSADTYSLMTPIGSAARAIRSMWTDDWPLSPLRAATLGLGGIGVLLAWSRPSARREWGSPWQAWVAFAALAPLPYMLVRGSQFEPYYYLWNLSSWIAAAALLNEAATAFRLGPSHRTIATAVAAPLVTFVIVLHGSSIRARAEVRSCNGIRKTMGAVLSHIEDQCARPGSAPSPVITYVGVGAPDMAGKDNLSYLPLLACGTKVKSYTSFVLTGPRHQVLTTAETSDRLMTEVDIDTLTPELRAATSADRTLARVASCPGPWGRVCVVDEDGGGRTIVVNFQNDR